MPPEKWEAIVAEAGEGQAEEDAEQKARNALIGQPAPPFPQTRWLNSEPLTWEALRGHVVILDFWAEWCGPCRNDLPEMARLHQQREQNGITVLGIHTPGSQVESIQKMIDLYGVHYPICIDADPPAGQMRIGLLSGQFAVRGIPCAFVVDRQGRIAGHGSLQMVLAIARSMLPEAER